MSSIFIVSNKIVEDIDVNLKSINLLTTSENQITSNK